MASAGARSDSSWISRGGLTGIFSDVRGFDCRVIQLSISARFSEKRAFINGRKRLRQLSERISGIAD